MNDLIERLEAAEVGSRELDGAIHDASEIGGWDMTWLSHKCYTTSLDAITGLIEERFGKIEQGLEYVIFGPDDQGWKAYIALELPNNGGIVWTSKKSKTPALALCQVLLKAIKAQGATP